MVLRHDQSGLPGLSGVKMLLVQYLAARESTCLDTIIQDKGNR
jgi:hypothetical protein